ncbi:hypothetical protein Tco_0933622 [Tanacetum coccineum]
MDFHELELTGDLLSIGVLIDEVSRKLCVLFNRIIDGRRSERGLVTGAMKLDADRWKARRSCVAKEGGGAGGEMEVEDCQLLFVTERFVSAKWRNILKFGRVRG